MRQGWIYLHFLLMCFLKCILFRSRMSPWLQLYSLKHLNLEACNDDLLPEKLNLCMKFSRPRVTKTSKMMPKTWNNIEKLATQFPRLLQYASNKLVAGKANFLWVWAAMPQERWTDLKQQGIQTKRAVLLVQAMGDGTSIGTEMKRIADDPQRIRTREIRACDALDDVGIWIAERARHCKQRILAGYAHEQVCPHARSASLQEQRNVLWESRQVLDVPVHWFQWMVGQWHWSSIKSWFQEFQMNPFWQTSFFKWVAKQHHSFVLYHQINWLCP